jgi:cellulose synthase/poly-beta-1,6-N-acetylglucosamine synthase-like glycosyltransferase/DNA-binding response OmpR family regulator
MTEPAAFRRGADRQSSAAARWHRQDTVLLLTRADPEWQRVAATLREAGYALLEATGLSDALDHLRRAVPDLVVLPADLQGLELLDRLRIGERWNSVPAIALTLPDNPAAMFEAFERGADDVVSYSAQPGELAARVRARLQRRAVARADMLRDPATGALTEESFALLLRREADRVRLTNRPACLAYITLHELPEVRAKLGQRAHDAVLAELVALVRADGRPLDEIGFSNGQLALLLPDTTSWAAQARLNRLVGRVHARTFPVDGTTLQLTPAFGFAAIEPGADPAESESRAWTATLHAAEQLDLQVMHWRHDFDKRTRRGRLRDWLDRRRTLFQVVSQQSACLGVPLLTYWGLDRLGLDITSTAYLLVVAALVFTALAIWVECLAAYRPEQPPEVARGRYPPASAIIAAYLPNEADTIVETVEAFLQQDYNQLQVILAYNTPEDLPVEEQLRRIAARDQRFLPLRVDWSTSKAQNVNAALARVTGTFVGVFDADHHPAPGAFRRAWRWLSNGVDVVQGHCVVRNGDDGFVQKLVTCEFEAIYGVAHPGRARMHGFGIFGGSNGYWRTATLRRTRLRSFMLTEDIDSSMRVLADGGRIVSDPGLVSTELSPERWGALWNQRLRWAQGWCQVSWRYLRTALRNERLTVRQRVGLLYLLGWREVYPWISLQIFPILAFWYLRGDPPISWVVPVFLATTAFTFSAGVVQAWTAWRLATPDLRRRGRWFLVYGLVSQLLYTEFKNVVARTAHLKEIMGERKWKVTPRSARAPVHAHGAGATDPARS